MPAADAVDLRPFLARAHALHRSAIIVDAHVDTLLAQRLIHFDPLRRHRPTGKGAPLFNHADLPRLLQAGVASAWFGLHYWPTESEAGWDEARRQVDLFHRLAGRDPRFGIATCTDDIPAARRSGRLASCLGCEGAHLLNGRLERVAWLRRHHVRYLTLTHFSRNRAATPALGRGADPAAGLTAWGRELIDECDRVGMMVDVAHLNATGVLEVCALSRRPVVCTHTGAFGVRAHARNVTDAGLRAIAATGGVIGIMFAPCFLARSWFADSACVVDHIDHVRRVVGIDHVALGSDFDGMLPTLPSDLRDCTDLPRITAGLLARGYSDGEIGKVLGGNWLRVLRRFDGAALDGVGAAPV